MKTLVMNEVFKIGDICLQVCSHAIIFSSSEGTKIGYYLTNKESHDNKAVLQQSGLTKDTLISGLKCDENEVSNIGTFPYFRSLALLTLAAEYLEKLTMIFNKNTHFIYIILTANLKMIMLSRYVQWNVDFIIVIKKSRTFDKIITNTPGWLIRSSWMYEHG
jgi:hypothetical protein